MKWRVAQLWIAGLVMLLTDFPAPLHGLSAADGPIGVLTRGLPDVVLPASPTDGLPTRYGLGFPVQPCGRSMRGRCLRSSLDSPEEAGA